MTTTLTIREEEVLDRQATHLVGTLGHVSEGKSTLIRALTGIKTQRHAKEQERNITIHLGYANCRVYQHRVTGELRAVQTRDPAPPATDWFLTAHLSFVDCPGHEAFLATMLGGASIMDTACLIIAANQEIIPQPQTLEHLIAAELMGLNRIAVVQNKLDLLEEADAKANNDKITVFVAETVAEAAPRLPISAQHGWGVGRVLEWVTALTPPARDLNAPARLTCVRSFDVNRPARWSADGTILAGAVIGGTLEQGVLVVGDWIEIRPGILSRDSGGEIVATPILSRVRGIRCESTDLPYAVPGSLIAIQTDLDPGLSIANGMVGQRIGVPGTLPDIVGHLRLRFHKLKRDQHEFGKHRVGDRVRLCSNVMTTEATITEIDDKKRVTVKLDRPLCAAVGERVGVLRFHREAGRELLEGSAEVRAILPWEHVADAEGLAEAVIPDRQIEWVPMERPAWSARALPSYDELLGAVMALKESGSGGGSGGGLCLPDINIQRVPKHTLLTSWPGMLAVMDRANEASEILYADHLKQWLEGELQTTSSVSADGILDIRGFWKVEDLRSLMRKYVTAHKRCAQCNGYETWLAKDSGVIKVWCSRCRTHNTIPQ